MNRNDALSLLARFKSTQLTDSVFDSYLLDYWCIDEEDDEFHALPKEVQKDLTSLEEPDLTRREKYLPLIELALLHEFKGIKNSYIESLILKNLKKNIEISGDVEKLYSCPCCEYLTLYDLADYDICRLCKWEDDGIRDLAQHSACNHTSLREARAIFKNKLIKNPDLSEIYMSEKP